MKEYACVGKYGRLIRFYPMVGVFGRLAHAPLVSDHASHVHGSLSEENTTPHEHRFCTPSSLPWAQIA